MAQPMTQPAQAGQEQTDLHFLVHILQPGPGSRLETPAGRRVQLVRTGTPDDAEAIRAAITQPGEIAFFAQRIAAGDHVILSDDRLGRIDRIGGFVSTVSLRIWDGNQWSRARIVNVSTIDRILPPPTPDAIHAMLPGPGMTRTICGPHHGDVRALRQLRGATCTVCRAAADRMQVAS